MNKQTLKPVHVVAAVIINVKGDILIAKRPPDSHQGGLWEFPGGKLEANESPRAGLERELNEELGIRVSHCEPFLEVRHDYPDKSVLLEVWRVNAFLGEARGRELQEIRWVAKPDLNRFDFPAANAAVLNKLLDSSLV